MLNHLQIFGEIVRSLRRDEFDDYNGRGWSRKKLGAVTGWSNHIIARIERGERANLDVETITKLADAFHLTTESRARFFLLAAAPMTAIARGERDSERVLESLVNQLKVEKRPAILHNAFYEIVAVNTRYLALYGIPQAFFARPDLGILQYQHLRLMFATDSPLHAVLDNRMERGLFRTMAYWRYLTLPYRHTHHFVQLSQALEAAYPLFREALPHLSQRLKDHDDVDLIRSINYRHPQFGEIGYKLDTKTHYTPKGELFYTMHVPHDPQTTTTFETLTANNMTYCLANPWEPFDQYGIMIEHNECDE